MSPDPLAGDVGNPQSLNRYAYVLNNPVTLTDPLGLGSGNGVEITQFCTNGHCPTTCSPMSDCNPSNNAGNNCTVNGASVPCGMAYDLIGSGVAAVCPNNYCPPGTVFQNSTYNNENPNNPEFYRLVRSSNPTLNCSGSDPSWTNYTCGWAPSSLQFIGTGMQGFLRPSDLYFVGPPPPVPSHSAAPAQTTTMASQPNTRCGPALGVVGVGVLGTALTVGAVAAAVYSGPEMFEGIEGAVTLFHIAPFGLAGPMVAAQGLKEVEKNCF